MASSIGEGGAVLLERVDLHAVADDSTDARFEVSTEALEVVGAHVLWDEQLDHRPADDLGALVAEHQLRGSVELADICRARRS